MQTRFLRQKPPPKPQKLEQLKYSMCSAVQRKLDRKVWHWHWQASIVVCGYCCTHVKYIGSNISQSHGIKQFVDDPLSLICMVSCIIIDVTWCGDVTREL
jgi:hypothetical protein